MFIRAVDYLSQIGGRSLAQVFILAAHKPWFVQHVLKALLGSLINRSSGIFRCYIVPN